jgi:hypothetical protein
VTPDIVPHAEGVHSILTLVKQALDEARDLWEPETTIEIKIVRLDEFRQDWAVYRVGSITPGWVPRDRAKPPPGRPGGRALHLSG